MKVTTIQVYSGVHVHTSLCFTICTTFRRSCCSVAQLSLAMTSTLRRVAVTPWQMPRWLKHRKSCSTQQSPVHSHKLLQSIHHTPNSLNLEQHIAQLPIQYDAVQSSQNHFHTETKQLTLWLAPEHHIWMPLIAWRSCSLCGRWLNRTIAIVPTHVAAIGLYMHIQTFTKVSS